MKNFPKSRRRACVLPRRDSNSGDVLAALLTPSQAFESES